MMLSPSGSLLANVMVTGKAIQLVILMVKGKDSSRANGLDLMKEIGLVNERASNP